ncbi:hypothetical protein LYNGBM3L_31830 [Moorena producens 3L]|uniref:Uncharacterized protein n=1 Tax=Moorena producens 3L TaxID=489825 RepID=F4XU41_9CYAN|nr:hypothetical protein LYNGBM3L_31830 [Moorena producens 3L]OLT66508.1 hypothetical protein BI334_17145 [Moorena producens 3L]
MRDLWPIKSSHRVRFGNLVISQFQLTYCGVEIAVDSISTAIFLEAISGQRSAISYQLSAISYQLSAISYQLSAISYQ